MNRLLHWLVIGMFILPLFACGGGGGGGTTASVPGEEPTPPPPAVVLSGTITDLTQDHVGGAMVTVTDFTTGAAVFATTADAAGRYSFDETQLPMGVILNVTAEGPAGSTGYFPASAKTLLSTDRASVLDLMLPSTRYRGALEPTVSGTIYNSVGGLVESETFIDGPYSAFLNLPADSLLNVPAPDTADVYLTPIDISQLGNGFGYYQTVLPLAATIGDIYPGDDIVTNPQVLELYAAAAFEILDSTNTPLAIDPAAVDPVVLTLPIPVDLQGTAPTSALLWLFDRASGKWEAVGDATKNVTVYTADVTMPGLYLVADTFDATLITGQLLFSDGGPVAGATVYVNGTVGDTYQQVLSTDATGNFVGLVKNTGTADFQFVILMSGVQVTHTRSVSWDDILPLSVDIGFPEATTMGTITLDSGDENDPNTIGFLPASGRLYVETDDAGDTDPVAISDVADVNFVADIFGENLSIQPTATGSEIKLSSSTVWSTTAIDLTAGTTDVVVDVKTGDTDPATGEPFYARITIDEVTQSIGGNIWTVTFSSQFSLTAF